MKTIFQHVGSCGILRARKYELEPQKVCRNKQLAFYIIRAGYAQCGLPSSLAFSHDPSLERGVGFFTPTRAISTN